MRTATESLAILAVAAFGQIWSAALAATLAAAERFHASAACYVVASVVTLAAAVGLMLAIGVIGAALGVLCGACVLLGGHLLYLRSLGFSAAPSLPLFARPETWRLVSRAGASASWPLAMQLQLTIALAALASPVGAVTAYTYAFFIAAIAFNITGASLGLVTLPGLVADLARRGRAAVLDYLGMTAPLGTFLYVPIAGAYAACGLPMLRAVLDGSLSPETILLLWDVSRILLVMGLVWTMLSAVSQRRAVAATPARADDPECDRDRRADRRAPRPAGRERQTVAIVQAAVGSGMFLAAAVMVFREADRRGAATRVAATCWPVIPLSLVFVSTRSCPRTASPAAVGLALVSIVVYLALGVLTWPSVARQALRLLLARR